ncbi:MAG: ABC transporter substrate-binding protein [Mariprofundus sp.]
MRYFHRFLLLILMAACLSGCPTEAPHLLKVGSNQWPGYEPLFLARDLGLYNDQQIKLVELPSSTESLDLLHEGLLDAAALTLDEALHAIDKGVGLTIVLILDQSNGADVLMGRPEISRLSAIKGKRVGVESTAVGAVMLAGALQAAGLTEAEIQPVYLTVDEHVAAYERGDVDAVVTFEPSKTRLLADGAHVLFDSSRIAGRIIDVLAVRTAVMAQYSQQLQQLVDGYFAARAYMDKHEEAAAARMAPRLAISGEELKIALQGLSLPDIRENRQWMEGSPSKLQLSASVLAQLMLKTGLNGREVDTSNLIDAAFIKDARP